MLLLRLLMAAGAIVGCSPASAQDWRPAKNIDIVVSSGPGGAADRQARVAQRFLQTLPGIPSVTVNNRPGGGAGVGSGPGMTVGGGLALKGTGRIPIALMGDGDFLMGNTAVWTAAHYAIPCLMVVCNNRSFYDDGRHQGRMAEQRGRPVENRWIGQRLDDPDIDIAGMARMQGAVGIGPVTESGRLQSSLEEAIAAVLAGQPCVVDARVLPGYDNRG